MIKSLNPTEQSAINYHKALNYKLHHKPQQYVTDIKVDNIRNQPPKLTNLNPVQQGAIDKARANLIRIQNKQIISDQYKANEPIMPLIQIPEPKTLTDDETVLNILKTFLNYNVANRAYDYLKNEGTLNAFLQVANPFILSLGGVKNLSFDDFLLYLNKFTQNIKRNPVNLNPKFTHFEENHNVIKKNEMKQSFNNFIEQRLNRTKIIKQIANKEVSNILNHIVSEFNFYADNNKTLSPSKDKRILNDIKHDIHIANDIINSPNISLHDKKISDIITNEFEKLINPLLKNPTNLKNDEEFKDEEREPHSHLKDIKTDLFKIVNNALNYKEKFRKTNAKPITNLTEFQNYIQKHGNKLTKEGRHLLNNILSKLKQKSEGSTVGAPFGYNQYNIPKSSNRGNKPKQSLSDFNIALNKIISDPRNKKKKNNSELTANARNKYNAIKAEREARYGTGLKHNKNKNIYF